MGIDDLHASIIIDAYEQIKYPPFAIFKSSIEKGDFPNLSKIAKVSLIFKSADPSDASNYWSISILLVFSKVLQCVMYNRVFDYLHKNKLIFNKHLASK